MIVRIDLPWPLGISVSNSEEERKVDGVEAKKKDTRAGDKVFSRQRGS